MTRKEAVIMGQLNLWGWSNPFVATFEGELTSKRSNIIISTPRKPRAEFGTCYRSKFKASIFPAYYHPQPKKLFFRCPNPRFLNFSFFSLHPFLPPNLYSKFPRNTIEALKQPYISMSSRSQIFSPTLYQIKRAWHLLTVLLQWGHPASPVELASRSEFHSVFLFPDIVEFLCGIPGSPISPTGDRLLVASKVAVAALRQYLDWRVDSLYLGFCLGLQRIGEVGAVLSWCTVRRGRWGHWRLDWWVPVLKGGSFGASMVVRVGVVVKILYFFFLGRSVYSLSLKILFFCCRCWGGQERFAVGVSVGF